MMSIKYSRLLVAATIAGFLAWTHTRAHRIGADGVRLETSQKALKQIERAQDQTRRWQENAHEAQENHTRAQADLAVRDRRIRDLVDRMRDQAPSAEQLAQHTLGAVSRYAAETERDFAECRSDFAEMGGAAARAAAAAWLYRDAWPVMAPTP